MEQDRLYSRYHKLYEYSINMSLSSLFVNFCSSSVLFTYNTYHNSLQKNNMLYHDGCLKLIKKNVNISKVCTVSFLTFLTSTFVLIPYFKHKKNLYSRYNV
ncbi:Transmembrane domain-containing protein [Orpheovirus IHUMI-LCC2]|uniref:Transmembrane domain-containing protein n=1 Tax=Orpheovirus IHUMI-LCC2 TaxID=2023057 RepID=A0A2I2L428_9VIRU|nr:Transmembrane domain-containing protein [Orpheovirus IHUMI-LCC2]SNW62302.1 Transmembrane domain-containing protein [Orpheovirus IHUMI-LCC2]